MFVISVWRHTRVKQPETKQTSFEWISKVSKSHDCNCCCCLLFSSTGLKGVDKRCCVLSINVSFKSVSVQLSFFSLEIKKKLKLKLKYSYKKKQNSPAGGNRQTVVVIQHHLIDSNTIPLFSSASQNVQQSHGDCGRHLMLCTSGCSVVSFCCIYAVATSSMLRNATDLLTQLHYITVH